MLTSGQEISVLEGLDLITELVKYADNRIVVMPGGGATERTIRKIIQQSGVKEIHFSGRTRQDSHMIYRNQKTFMGGTFRREEFSLAITDADRI